MLTALYTRVSTEQQVDRDSLGTQKGQLEAYCKAHNIRNYRLYEETGKSAKDTNRPKLKRLLQDVRAGKVSAVIVTRLDRITRSIVDLWRLIREFRENHVDFISLAERVDTEGPAGRFLANILGSLAQFEREIIAKRVTESMHHRALQGKWNGGPIPFGYTTQGRLCNELVRAGMPKDEAAKLASKSCPQQKILYLDKNEAKTVRKIYQVYLETRSIRETARRLNAGGHKTRTGSRWSATTVSRILTTPTYVGKLCYGKRKTDLDTGKIKRADKSNWKLVDGVHKGIVPPETFELAQETLMATAQKPKRRARFYPLSGLLRCGKCGRSMHGYTYTKPNGSVYSYYKCPRKRPYDDKKDCDGLTVPAERLEEFVAETLEGLSNDKAFLADKEKMLKALQEEACSAAGGTDDESDRLRKEHKDLESRRESLLEHLERRVIDDSLFKERYEKIMALLEENRIAQAQRQEAIANHEAIRECLEASFEEISSFGKNWELLDPQGRASLLQTVINQIEVTEKNIKLKIYLDHPPNSVEASSRTGRGSWRRRA
jgi:site-specific DNA recombinase